MGFPIRAKLVVALAAVLCASWMLAATADAAYYRAQRTNDAGLTILFAFKVRNDRIVFEKIKAPLHCGGQKPDAYIDGSGAVSISIDPSSGKFRDEFKFGRLSDVLKGQAKRRTIIGRFRSNGDCHTGTSENPWLQFNAVRVPNRPS